MLLFLNKVFILYIKQIVKQKISITSLTKIGFNIVPLVRGRLDGHTYTKSRVITSL